MDTRTEIEALATEFAKAFNNQDATELASFYTADCKFLPPNLPLIEGRAGVEELCRQMFDMGCRSLDLETTDVLQAGDLVVEVGRYTMTIQPPGGDPVQDVGKYLDVRRRQSDGGLRIVLDTFTSDLPAPTA